MKKAGFLFSALLIMASVSAQGAYADALRIKCNTTANVGAEGAIYLSLFDGKTISYQLADSKDTQQLYSGTLNCELQNGAGYSCSGDIFAGVAFQQASINLAISNTVLQVGAGAVKDNTQNVDYTCTQAPAHELKGADADEMSKLVGASVPGGIGCISHYGANTCFFNGTTENDPTKDSNIWKLLHHAGYLNIPSSDSEGNTGQPTIGGGSMKCSSNPSICSFK